uniref:Serine protease family S33 putative n=1 Tax=Albugo laibachii Nc14 TaxID=890382 RepID=F0WZN9_9STRA|nr:serine protease family S33 putative [Albugo laibachii Nc14]|eukprot:CCA26965.1 serine protease family S33 putative [Albugo laibachii Nc14]
MEAVKVFRDAEDRYVFQGRFQNARNQSLACYGLLPAPSHSVRGIVIFFHGIGEYAGRFAHVFQYLSRIGFASFSYDFVGHGHSQHEANLRAHMERFQHILDDSHQYATLVREELLPKAHDTHADTKYLDKPLIVMGISFGALLGLHFALSERNRVNAVVLVSPAISVEYTPILRFQQALANVLVKMLPNASLVPGVNVQGLSKDKQVIREYLCDPLIHASNLTIRTGFEILQAMRSIEGAAELYTSNSNFSRIPLLIVQGSEDIVTSVQSAKRFFDRIGSTDKSFEHVKGGYHCLFHEPERLEILNKISIWLISRFPGENSISKL